MHGSIIRLKLNNNYCGKIHLTFWETKGCKNWWDQDKNLLCTTQQGASEHENGEYIVYM